MVVRVCRVGERGCGGWTVAVWAGYVRWMEEWACKGSVSEACLVDECVSMCGWRDGLRLLTCIRILLRGRSQKRSWAGHLGF